MACQAKWQTRKNKIQKVWLQLMFWLRWTHEILVKSENFVSVSLKFKVWWQFWHITSQSSPLYYICPDVDHWPAAPYPFPPLLLITNLQNGAARFVGSMWPVLKSFYLCYFATCVNVFGNLVSIQERGDDTCKYLTCGDKGDIAFPTWCLPNRESGPGCCLPSWRGSFSPSQLDFCFFVSPESINGRILMLTIHHT